MLKITLSVMWRKSKEEIQLKHPPYPPSKEGGISLTIPLSKGGLRGIVPKTFPLPYRNIRQKGYENNELF